MRRSNEQEDSVLIPTELAPWDVMQKICEQFQNLKSGEVLTVRFEKGPRKGKYGRRVKPAGTRNEQAESNS